MTRTPGSYVTSTRISCYHDPACCGTTLRLDHADGLGRLAVVPGVAPAAQSLMLRTNGHRRRPADRWRRRYGRPEWGGDGTGGRQRNGCKSPSRLSSSATCRTWNDPDRAPGRSTGKLSEPMSWVSGCNAASDASCRQRTVVARLRSRSSRSRLDFERVNQSRPCSPPRPSRRRWHRAVHGHCRGR